MIRRGRQGQKLLTEVKNLFVRKSCSPLTKFTYTPLYRHVHRILPRGGGENKNDTIPHHAQGGGKLQQPLPHVHAIAYELYTVF